MALFARMLPLIAGALVVGPGCLLTSDFSGIAEIAPGRGGAGQGAAGGASAGAGQSAGGQAGEGAGGEAGQAGEGGGAGAGQSGAAGGEVEGDCCLEVGCSATGRCNPITLEEGAGELTRRGMARSDTFLYWGRLEQGQGQIRRKEVHGSVGLATEVTTWLTRPGAPSNLRALGGWLYWTELVAEQPPRTAFFRAALAADEGPAGPLFERDGEVGSVTADATHLYWTETNTGEGLPSDGNVARVPLQDGASWSGAEVFDHGSDEPRAVAVGQGQVVWASASWPLGALYAKAVAKNETNLPSVLVDKQDRPVDVAFLGDALLWLNVGDDGGNGTGRKAMRKSLPSGEVEVLASMSGRPQHVAVRDGVVAWVAGVESETGSVWAMRPGEAAVQVLDAQPRAVTFPQAIAVDRRAVYWTNNDSRVMAVGHCACAPP